MGIEGTHVLSIVWWWSGKIPNFFSSQVFLIGPIRDPTRSHIGYCWSSPSIMVMWSTTSRTRCLCWLWFYLPEHWNTKFRTDNLCSTCGALNLSLGLKLDGQVLYLAFLMVLLPAPEGTIGLFLKTSLPDTNFIYSTWITVLGGNKQLRKVEQVVVTKPIFMFEPKLFVGKALSDWDLLYFLAS